MFIFKYSVLTSRDEVKLQKGMATIKNLKFKISELVSQPYLLHAMHIFLTSNRRLFAKCILIKKSSVHLTRAERIMMCDNTKWQDKKRPMSYFSSTSVPRPATSSTVCHVMHRKLWCRHRCLLVMQAKFD